jgi:hypothetical protein
MLDHLEKIAAVSSFIVVALVSRALEGQLSDVVLIGAALSATVGVWKLLLSPIIKKVDKIVEVAESQQEMSRRLEVLELLVIKLSDESHTKSNHKHP